MEIFVVVILLAGCLFIFVPRRPGKPKKPEMVATENGILFEGKDIPFSSCRHLFFKKVSHYLNGVYTGTAVAMEFADKDLKSIAKYSVFFDENKEEYAEIEPACDEINERWQNYILPVYEEKFAKDRRISFPTMNNERNFVEITPQYVALSETGSGGKMQYGKGTVIEKRRGSLYVTDKDQQLVIELSKFADSDVLYTFLYRFIMVKQHIVPYLNSLSEGGHE